jgi:acetate kinase
VRRRIEALGELAPLHNEPALQVIDAVSRRLGGLPMVASFDTSFHRTLPPRAATYAIPYELTQRHGIQRFGFHGLAHRYMARRYVELSGRRLDTSRLITLQLGSGCSITAIEGGRSVDTSMGLTPLEGLVMVTRSGDIDPALVPFLAQREDISAETVAELLNTRSGLLGVSGRSGDMQALLEAEATGDARAALAVELFCYRARKYLGAYAAALGGVDAVVFGGGIGENAPAVRERIAAGFEFAGLRLNQNANATVSGRDALISEPESPINAWVVAVDEEVEIARDVQQVLTRGEP